MPSSRDSLDVEDAGDTIIAEEIAGEAPPNTAQPSIEPSAQKRPNAFTELMSGAKKPKSTPITTVKDTQKAKSAAKKAWDPRDGLIVYIEHPEQNPEGKVIEYDDEFVVINDKYPKASVHLLLLSRDPTIYSQHPLHILSTNPDFLAKVRTRVDRLKHLAASELRRQYGQFSASDAPYQSALEDLMSSPDPPSPDQRDALLPQGRDWLSEIKVGVHTHPSMNHFHIHVMSREMYSPWLKHKKHYLSFNTSFMVPFEDFPLEEGSKRFHPGDWPSWDMVCWRCGENFKNKFAALKRHLDDEEFEAWKKR